MAATTTKPKAQTAPLTEAPPAQLPATIKAKDAWENFQHDIEARATEIASQLPSNLPRERFINASIAAVKANTGILLATPRSLMAAITKAAQDGLLPDGREGIITVYNGKGGAIAQWNPMLFGIRKRARELDGLIIDAQVVVDGDEYDFELGDEPRITHKPKPRADKIEAAAGIAAYAIFRHPVEGIIHREWMWKPDVFATMNQSKAKDSLMWTVFWTEGWRKAVVRRGSKSVPVSPKLQALIQRDDENFEFPKDQPRLSPPREFPAIPGTETASPASQDEAGDPTGGNVDQTTGEVSEPASEAPIEVSEDGEKFLTALEGALKAADTDEDVDRIFEERDPQTTLADEPEEAMTRAFALKAGRKSKIKRELEAAGQGNLLDEPPAKKVKPFPGDE